MFSISSPTSCRSREQSVSPEPPPTEVQLRKMLQVLKADTKQLELGIAALRTNCDKTTASLRPLEDEHDELLQEATKGLTRERLAALSDPKAVHDFKRQIKERQQQLLALFAVASMLHALVAIKWGSLRYFDKPPTIVCFPCKHPSLCAACYGGLLRCHEAAKREKQRLERAHRRLPDDVRRDAVLRCPYCRATAEYASVASTSRLRYSWGEEGGSCTVLVVRKLDCLSVLAVLAACITASAAQGSSH
uniref:Uncharacterized protein n=1 Tax=Vitrella brassicaformis TaxID=1169539 RepID=A0A7S1KBE6_9ALVE|mmetsp:Transcript_4599/g.10671  ORF Transcript_4599/g.10671 Transcript_4599/m.10671 type:complete len:248 (+) Transcript_4599:93-836(+)